MGSDPQAGPSMIESPEESDHTDRKWMREVARSHGIDELGCAYQTAYEKLRELEDAGEIDSRKIGNVRLWSLAAEAGASEEDTGEGIER